MIMLHFGRTGIFIAAWVLALMTILAPHRALSQAATVTAVVHGHVRDASGRPMANATVLLKRGTFEQTHAEPTETRHTDSEGRYRFEELRAGTYTLRAEMAGYVDAIVTPVNVIQNETTKVDLVLTLTKSTESQGASPKTPATGTPEQAPQFFDEPQFTVAGVTQATKLWRTRFRYRSANHRSARPSNGFIEQGIGWRLQGGDIGPRRKPLYATRWPAIRKLRRQPTAGKVTRR